MNTRYREQVLVVVAVDVAVAVECKLQIAIASAITNEIKIQIHTRPMSQRTSHTISSAAFGQVSVQLLLDTIDASSASASASAANVTECATKQHGKMLCWRRNKSVLRQSVEYHTTCNVAYD